MGVVVLVFPVGLDVHLDAGDSCYRFTEKRCQRLHGILGKVTDDDAVFGRTVRNNVERLNDGIFRRAVVIACDKREKRHTDHKTRQEKCDDFFMFGIPFFA